MQTTESVKIQEPIGPAFGVHRFSFQSNTANRAMNEPLALPSEPSSQGPPLTSSLRADETNQIQTTEAAKNEKVQPLRLEFSPKKETFFAIGSVKKPRSDDLEVVFWNEGRRTTFHPV